MLTRLFSPARPIACRSLRASRTKQRVLFFSQQQQPRMSLNMAADMVHLEPVERLSPRVIRILGGNPGKYTLQGTNTYLVGTGSSRILIDTAQGEAAWKESLKSVLEKENASISKALITHWHLDHTKGVPDLLSLSPDTKIYKNDPMLFDNADWLDIKDGQKFESEGATLRAVFSPGHTTDHMAFVLEEEDSMFTADNVLGQGTAVFEDLATYMNSLELMLKQFNGKAYPGHGPVLDDGNAKIREYIAHRQSREKEIVQVMASDRQKRWTSMGIVKVVYKNYPENLHQPAEHGVRQVLSKLQREGKVAASDEKGSEWWLTDSANL